MRVVRRHPVDGPVVACPVAPPVVLEATSHRTLSFVPLEVLQAHAWQGVPPPVELVPVLGSVRDEAHLLAVFMRELPCQAPADADVAVVIHHGAKDIPIKAVYTDTRGAVHRLTGNSRGSLTSSITT